MKKLAAISLLLPCSPSLFWLTRDRWSLIFQPRPSSVRRLLISPSRTPAARPTRLLRFTASNGTVLIFIATQCPVSNGYNERMEKLAQDFKARGINVIGINANSTESVADVKDHAAKNNLTFTDS